ncbi:MAG: hypothetical protein JWQ81_1760 [Amycolatopsis sp.]|nr:hypothetical protein [Amycolatopsis sp.]MCU1681021.1 hypothetical protein [Amycolatopsis sp.]
MVADDLFAVFFFSTTEGGRGRHDKVVPYSALFRGPSAESTASVPTSADSSTGGSGMERSAVTVRTRAGKPTGCRAMAVTS